MSANYPSLFSQEYSTNVQLLLQQKESKFRAAVTVGSGHKGEQASPVDQVGPVEMQPVNNRFAPKTRTDAAVDRRWVLPQDFDLQQLVDSFDKVRLVSDPQSVYVRNTVNAANRRMDHIVIDSFFAASNTGKTGTSTTNFGTNQFVGVNTGGTTSNLNVAKLKAAYELFLANEVDVESDPIYCAITAKQNTALLNEIQIISSDFKASEQPTVSGGKVMSFLGINFIHSQLLDTATDDQGGTSRAVPMWAKSGMYLGFWIDPTYRVRQAEELKGNPWEVYAMMTLGATRLEEKKVVRIWCRE